MGRIVETASEKAVSKHLGRLPQTGCGELLLITLMFPVSRQAQIYYRCDIDTLTSSGAVDPVYCKASVTTILGLGLGRSPGRRVAADTSSIH